LRFSVGKCEGTRFGEPVRVDFGAGDKGTVCKTIGGAARVDEGIHLERGVVLRRKEVSRNEKRFAIAYGLKLEWRIIEDDTSNPIWCL
jgi:hypothetical protein